LKTTFSFLEFKRKVTSKEKVSGRIEMKIPDSHSALKFIVTDIRVPSLR
jgi:hypothetical protein